MYGRADGMPSFQLTVAVCARNVLIIQYIPDGISIVKFYDHGLLSHDKAVKPQSQSPPRSRVGLGGVPARVRVSKLYRSYIAAGQYLIQRNSGTIISPPLSIFFVSPLYDKQSYKYVYRKEKPSFQS